MLVLDAWSFGLFVPVEINMFKQSLIFFYSISLYTIVVALATTKDADIEG